MSITPQAWRAGGRVHVHRGHEFFYVEQAREVGVDRALLLIHGFPTSSWDWHKMWAPLVEAFPRVVAADMMGFGFSSKPADYRYSILDQADLLQGLLAHLGVARFHILAHDYGDTVAQELLARELENKAQVDSCVMLNGGLFPEVHRARTIQKLLLTPLGPLLSRLMNRNSFNRTFRAIFGANTQPTEQELEEFWELMHREGGNKIMHKLIRYMPERIQHRNRWVGALQKTKVPLRVINGPDDPISGAHMVARYRELVPNPDTVLLPGVGHYPQTEDPDGVLKAFLEFHARLSERL